MAVGNGVGGTGLDAVATEDAAGVVDIVNLGVAFAGGDAIRGGILGGFDINAVRGAGGGAQEAADTLFVAVFVTLEDVDTAVARLDGGWDVGKALRGGLAKHGAQGDAEAFVEGEEGFADFLNDGGH